MADMLRSELVKTGKLDVVDKKSMGTAIHEIQSQMSDYMTNENVKQLGKMLNADYLVIGHVLTLSNTAPEILKDLLIENNEGIKYKNSANEKISTQINNTNAEMFDGTWTSEIVHDGITDIYSITFEKNNKIDISIISIEKNGKESKAIGSGRYVFNDSEKILSVTINSLKGNIKQLKSIKWKSFVNPASDELMFSYSIPVSSASNAKNIRADFYKE